MLHGMKRRLLVSFCVYACVDLVGSHDGCTPTNHGCYSRKVIAYICYCSEHKKQNHK
jgi:hypothetical protein